MRLVIEKMGHGGKGIGSDPRGKKPVFVVGGFPGDEVEARIQNKGKHSFEATIDKLVKPSKLRTKRRCEGCADGEFQVIGYADQVRLKQSIVEDQFERARLGDVPIKPMVSHPQIWHSRRELRLSADQSGGFGVWSRERREIVAAKRCALLHPAINEVLGMIDLALPELRKLTIRVGDSDDVQLIFAVEEAEPPAIEIDLDVSVAVVLPDGVAGTLIGDAVTVHEIDGKLFRASAGSEIYRSPESAVMVREAVRELAGLSGRESVVECGSGIGIITDVLAEGAAAVVGIEQNRDSVENLVGNLADTENVSVLNDWAEDGLAVVLGSVEADLVVFDVGARNLSDDLVGVVVNHGVERILVSEGDLGRAAQTAKLLQKLDYVPEAIIPLDLIPQSFHIHTVSAWKKS